MIVARTVEKATGEPSKDRTNPQGDESLLGVTIGVLGESVGEITRQDPETSADGPWDTDFQIVHRAPRGGDFLTVFEWVCSDVQEKEVQRADHGNQRVDKRPYNTRVDLEPTEVAHPHG